jgi:predicted NUDIX family phosphoesterase
VSNTDKYNGQKVLVIPNPTFLKADNGWVSKAFSPFFEAPIESPKFILRKDAEEDENYRQIIPYAFIRSKKTHRYLTYPRKGREERLHSMYSLGIGGHIDEEDYTQFKGQNISIMHMVSLGLTRELLEEVPNIVTVGERPELISTRGFVYSDASAVDRVHIAVAIRIDVADEFDADTEEIAGEWKTPQEIADMYDRFESWSQVVISNCINISKQ